LYSQDSAAAPTTGANIIDFLVVTGLQDQAVRFIFMGDIQGFFTGYLSGESGFDEMPGPITEAHAGL
jgi:hypothetical protein